MFSDPRNVGEVCDCLECQAAGCTAAKLVLVRVPGPTGPPVWLHGEPLKHWHAERNAFLEQFHKLAEAPRVMPRARVLTFDRPRPPTTTIPPPADEDLPLEPDDEDLPLED